MTCNNQCTIFNYLFLHFYFLLNNHIQFVLFHHYNCILHFLYTHIQHLYLSNNFLFQQLQLLELLALLFLVVQLHSLGRILQKHQFHFYNLHIVLYLIILIFVFQILLFHLIIHQFFQVLLLYPLLYINSHQVYIFDKPFFLFLCIYL